MGDCQAVAIPVLRRFAIHEHHVVMHFVRRDAVKRDVPGIQHAVARERDFLPMREGADDFNPGRSVGLSVRQAPAENLRKSRDAVLWSVLPYGERRTGSHVNGPPFCGGLLPNELSNILLSAETKLIDCKFSNQLKNDLSPNNLEAFHRMANYGGVPRRCE